MPGKSPALPIPLNVLEKLKEVLEATDEFPYHDGNMLDPADPPDGSRSDQRIKAATVLHIVSFCKQFRKAFTLNTMQKNQRIAQIWAERRSEEGSVADRNDQSIELQSKSLLEFMNNSEM